ncbi:hypothetical protein D9M71_383460 [compost metagenome]
MQVRPSAVAGIARLGQHLTLPYPLPLRHHHRAAHQVQVDAHGAVRVQNPDKVTRGVGAAPALAVLRLHHHPFPRRDDGCAFGHGDIHGVAPSGPKMTDTAIGALSDAERPANPRERIAEALGPFARVTHGLQQGRTVVQQQPGPPPEHTEHLRGARRQQPAHDTRGVTALCVDQVVQPQLYLYRHMQLVSCRKAHATVEGFRVQQYLAFERFDHGLEQHQGLGAGARAVGIGDDTGIVSDLVERHALARRRGHEQCTEQQQARGHDSGFLTVMICRSLAAGFTVGIAVGRMGQLGLGQEHPCAAPAQSMTRGRGQAPGVKCFCAVPRAINRDR